MKCEHTLAPIEGVLTCSLFALVYKAGSVAVQHHPQIQGKILDGHSRLLADDDQTSHRKLCRLVLLPQSIAAQAMTSILNSSPARAFRKAMTSAISSGVNVSRPPISMMIVSSATCRIRNSVNSTTFTRSSPPIKNPDRVPSRCLRAAVTRP